MAAPTAAERGREVRRRLLDAAAELIPELGWAAVSTRVLAERAGVTSGLVHYHFPSLPALLRQAALARIRQVLAETGPALAAGELAAGGPDGWLGGLFGALDAYSGTDPTSLLFVETYLAATRDEELRRALAAEVASFTDAVAGRLAAARLDRPRETAAVLAATVDGVLLHRVLNPDLTAATVVPVVRRLLGPAPAKDGRTRGKADPT